MSSANHTILVTGSTGNSGSAAVKHLARLFNENKSNVVIRAGVRDENKAKEKFKDIKLNSNVKLEYVNTETSCDNKNPEESLKKSFSGVDTVIVIPPGEGRIEVGVSFVEAAKSAKVKNIVLLSVAAVAIPDKKAQLFGQQFGTIESAIKDSGINYVFVRAPFFLDNHWGNVGTIKSQSAFYYPVKPDSKHVQIAANDVGEALACAVVNADKHKNKTYTITSTEAVSNKQYAEYYSELAGKTVNFVQVPDKAAVDAMVGMGYPEWQSKGIVELWNGIDQNIDVLVKATSDFKVITGHDPVAPKAFIQSLAGALKQ
jgi:uncharacterized protein YbjT (DUF2867 family)